MTATNANDLITTSVRVRIAELEDVERITSVINSAFRDAENFFIDEDRMSLESVRNLFNTGKFLLAKCNGVVVGCVYVEPRGDRAYLGLLAVEPARQHSGTGSVLMDAAEDYSRGLGLNFMDIKAVNLREELCAFYQRRGYVETGRSAFPADVKTKMPCHFVDMSKPLRPLPTTRDDKQ